MTHIPRVIHYCWFGGGPLSAQAERTLHTWRTREPDYEIRCWNESNFDIERCPFVKGAYAAGKWAFVSDYARFRVLYDFGGVYMDVGSELIRDFDDLVDGYAPFVGIESGSCTANSGLIAVCEPNDELIGKVLEKYESTEFVDTDEFCATHTVNDMLTDLLIEKGFVRNGSFQQVCGWSFLPHDYFDPDYGFGGYSISENTRSIHKGSGSWGSSALKRKRRIAYRLTPFVGRRLAQILGRVIGEISCNGPVRGAKNLLVVSASVFARKKYNQKPADGTVNEATRTGAEQ